MWNPEKWYRWTNLQSRNRDAVVKNKHMATRGQAGLGCTERLGLIYIHYWSVQFSHSIVSDSLRPLELKASLSITNSLSLLKLMSIELMMPSNHLILCHPLLLPPSVFPSISISSNESVLHHRWSVYWSFNFNISPSDEQPGLIFRMDSLHPSSSISLQSKGLSTVFSNTTVRKHQFFDAQLFL